MSSNNKAINQIKNISQQDKTEPEMKAINISNKIKITNFIN